MSQSLLLKGSLSRPLMKGLEVPRRSYDSSISSWSGNKPINVRNLFQDEPFKSRSDSSRVGQSAGLWLRCQRVFIRSRFSVHVRLPIIILILCQQPIPEYTADPQIFSDQAKITKATAPKRKAYQSLATPIRSFMVRIRYQAGSHCFLLDFFRLWTNIKQTSCCFRTTTG